jgi:hypothetical protein
VKTIAILKLVMIAPFLSACASLSVDPTIHSSAAAAFPVPSSCRTATGDDRLLCDALTQTSTLGLSYITTARALDNEHRIYSATQLASAGAIAGFSVFGAHADNTSGAALAGGMATTLEGGLHPAARARIYARAFEATQCVALAAAPFLGDTTVLDARLDRAAWYASAAQAAPALSEFAASRLTIPPGEERLTAMLVVSASRGLNETENRLRAIADTLLRDAGAQQTAHERVSAALAGIRKYVADATAQQTVDLGQIATQLRTPPKPAQPAASGGGAGRASFLATLNNPARLAIAGVNDDSMGLLGPQRTWSSLSVADYIALGSLIEAAAMQRAPTASVEGPGEQEFAAIATCVPTFTPPAPATTQPAR